MKLDRHKLIEENRKYLNEEYLDMINRLSDYEICKYMLWDRVHSIIYTLTMKIQSNISIFIICLQLAALFTELATKYKNLSETVMLKINLVCRTIVFLGLIINIGAQFFIHRFNAKAIEEIQILNEYSDLIKDTVTEEVNRLNELQGK